MGLLVEDIRKRRFSRLVHCERFCRNRKVSLLAYNLELPGFLFVLCLSDLCVDVNYVLLRGCKGNGFGKRGTAKGICRMFESFILFL